MHPWIITVMLDGPWLYQLVATTRSHLYLTCLLGAIFPHLSTKVVLILSTNWKPLL